MTTTYRLRGIEQDSKTAATTNAPAPPSTTDIHATSLRRIAPASARDSGVTDIEAAGDEVIRVVLENVWVSNS